MMSAGVDTSAVVGGLVLVVIGAFLGYAVIPRDVDTDNLGSSHMWHEPRCLVRSPVPLRAAPPHGIRCRIMNRAGGFSANAAANAARARASERQMAKVS